MNRCLLGLLLLVNSLLAQSLYGYSTVTQASIDNYGLNYTVGQGFICALTDEGKVVCDGENNKFGQQNVPLLKEPVTQLAAGERHVCALDADGVVCWGLGFDPNGQRMEFSSKPSFIAAGPNFTCASDSKGITCVGNDSRYGKLDAPKIPNAKYLTLNETGGCAINEKSTEITCWGLYLSKKSLSQNGTNLAILSDIDHLVYPGNKLCFLTTDRKVACWDGDSVARVEINEIENVYALASAGSNMCVIGEGGSVCLNASGQKIDHPTIEQIGTIAGGLDSFCGAGPNGALCWGDDELRDIDKVKPVMGQGGSFGISSFSMTTMEKTFVNLKEYVYGYKGRFLEDIAKHVEGYSIDESDPLYLSYKKVLVRALVLNSMQGFVEDLTSETLEKFREKYSKIVAEINQKVDVKSLTSIELNSDTLATSLVMITAGLQASRRFIANTSDRDVLESLIVDLGKIKSDLGSSEGSSQEQLAACQELLRRGSTRHLISVMTENGRTHGIGLTISSLSQYLMSK